MSARSRSSEGEMPFLDHLEEFRWRILWSFLAVGLGTVVGFILVQYFDVMELLLRPVRPYLNGTDLLFFSPATPFFFTLKLSLIIGLVLAFPIVVYQIWVFLAPALKEDEKKVIVPSLYFGLFLFAAGVALAYFAVLPLALRFLMGFQQDFLEAAIEAGMYLGFVVRLLLAFGIVFELPVVVMILSAMGLITPEFLKDKRRHSIVAVTILASMITPGDIASTFMMIVPMVVLYEISIVLSRIIHRRKAEQEEEPLEPSPDPPPGAVESS